MKPNRLITKGIQIGLFCLFVFYLIGCFTPIPIATCGFNMPSGSTITTKRALFLIRGNENISNQLPLWFIALPDEEAKSIGFSHPKLGQRIRIHHAPTSFQEHNRVDNNSKNRFSQEMALILPKGTKIRIVGPQKSFVGLGYEIAMVGVIKNGPHAGIPVDIQDVTWIQTNIYFPLFPLILTSCYNLDDQLFTLD